MNLKTAERLLEYRKKAGLSQEELAEKIGVSRQAVSKWERAEASPDTDNLIALADVYGVTLDELIKGSKAAPEKSVSDNDGIDCNVVDEKSGQRVHINLKGLHVESKGAEVHIDKNGVFVKDDQGNTVKRDLKLPDGHIYCKSNKSVSRTHYAFKHFPYFVLTAIAYLMFGYFGVCGGWSFGWLIFLTVPLYYTLVSAIFNRNASHFAYPVLVTMVYLYLGFFQSAWHPMWVLFLTVPFYYFFCEFVKKIVKKL